MTRCANYTPYMDFGLSRFTQSRRLPRMCLKAGGHPLAKVAAKQNSWSIDQRKRCFSVPQFVCNTGVGASDRFTSAMKSA